jgi:hypothetical protein
MVRSKTAFWLWAWFVLAIALGTAAVGQSSSADADRDGISDEREQVLLEKFRPTFMVSATDCAVRPARFKTGQASPELLAQDGTIYGQVTPIAKSDRVEIHYYTLWEKDCGRVSHPLDVEHVSVMVTNEADPKALYWYAGAHENTLCDISSGARAEAIGAEKQGARVWSSSGKHALYLREAMCGKGCGADSCEVQKELEVTGPVINVGERGVPANGAEWTSSPQWLMAEKMDSDFPAAVLARLDETSGDTVATLRGRSTVRGTIQVSDVVLGSAGTGAEHTGAALDTANTHTSKSLGKAKKATGNSLKRAWRAVFGKKEPTAPEAVN